MLSLPVQEKFRRFITPHIKQLLAELNYDSPFDTDRITVWADLDAYRWKEDEFIWAQKRGKIPEVYQVFIDSIFICYLSEDLPVKKTLADFWKGFLEAYERDDNAADKLWLDHENYELMQRKRREQDRKNQKMIEKAIQDKPVTNETEALAKEIALDVTKESQNDAS